MIKELTICVRPGGFQANHGNALAQGAKKHGVKVKMQPMGAAIGTHHVACWGWRIGQYLKTASRQVLVMERGYIGDRFAWTSLGWNGLNGRATFNPKNDPARFNENFSALMKPWKPEGGEYVLLIGQVPGDASLAGRDLKPWYEQAAETAAKEYHLPVRFRPHPLAARRGAILPVKGAPFINGTLDSALSKAAVVVTYNSNTAVDAVLAGVPTVTQNAGSMAREVSGHTIGDRVTPDREEWAARLAWCQWSIEELRSGVAWETVTQ